MSSNKPRKKSVVGNRRDTMSSEQKVKKNARGGVHITQDEIKLAFDFLDTDKTGKLSLANLKKRLGVFFPNMTAKEYRFLMNNRREMTVQDLKDLLIDNEVTNFDPIAEAFKAYDPAGEGCISAAKLREVFENFGFGEITDHEIEIITRTADVDGDGVISLDDFRYMLDMHQVSNLVAMPASSTSPTKDGPGKELPQPDTPSKESNNADSEK